MVVTTSNIFDEKSNTRMASETLRARRIVPGWLINVSNIWKPTICRTSRYQEFQLLAMFLLGATPADNSVSRKDRNRGIERTRITLSPLTNSISIFRFAT